MRGGLSSERGRRQVATLLVALAALAECAAGRAFPVRWFLLALMRHAERVARKSIVEMTGWNPTDLDDAFGIDGAPDDPVGPPGSGSGPADALALGWRLRALAAILRALLPPEDPSGRAETRAIDAARRLAALCALSIARPAGCARPAPDTS